MSALARLLAAQRAPGEAATETGSAAQMDLSNRANTASPDYDTAYANAWAVVERTLPGNLAAQRFGARYAVDKLARECDTRFHVTLEWADRWNASAARRLGQPAPARLTSSNGSWDRMAAYNYGNELKSAAEHIKWLVRVNWDEVVTGLATDGPVETAEAAHDPVNHPSHYTSHPSGIECITVTRLLSCDLGNAVKYVWRRGDKGNAAQDLDKSLFYLDDAAKHLIDAAAAGRWRRIICAARHLLGGGDALLHGGVGLHTPPAAAEMLRCVADHDSDPAAADFYRAIAAMDWDGARDAVLGLRSAFPS